MSNRAVSITHRCVPGRRDDVHQIWDQHLRPAIEANPNHEAYFYCFDAADPDVIRAFQLYRDAESARAFLDTDDYRAYVAAVEPLLTGQPAVAICSLVWSKS